MGAVAATAQAFDAFRNQSGVAANRRRAVIIFQTDIVGQERQIRNPALCALIDEVHEHPDNSVIEMLRAGTKAIQDALIFEITNSGFDRKSVCFAEHEYSRSPSLR